MLKTGSPGSAFVKANVKSEIPKRRGTSKRSLFMKNALIVFPAFSFVTAQNEIFVHSSMLNIILSFYLRTYRAVRLLKLA
jgi:hypothetical protein